MGVEGCGWTDDGWVATLSAAGLRGERQLSRARDQELDQVVAQGIVVGKLVQLGAGALLWKSVFDDLGDARPRTVCHEKDLVGEQQGFVDIVGDHEGGLARLGADGDDLVL
jgi:hypothetical protein